MKIKKRKKSFVKRLSNGILHILARFLPGCTSIRPFLHKLRGVKIHGKIFIGDDVYLENEYPEQIEIHDEAMVVLRATIISHGRGLGKIVIKKKARIGPSAVVAASGGRTIIIGEGSVVAAGSVVTKDVPPYTFVRGVPAIPVAKITVPMTFKYSYEEFIDGLRPLR